MKKVTCCFLLMFFLSAQSYSQTKLGKAEGSLKDNDQKVSRSSNNHHDSDYDDSFVAVIAYYAAEAVLSVSYYTLIESPFEYGNHASTAGITKRPYYTLNKGNYNFSPNEEEINFFRADLSGYYISENNNLKGMHLNLDMRFLKRMGAELDYLQLWENNPNFGKDHLALYSLLAKYYRVRTEKFDLYWGLGTTYVDGSVDEFGFTYGLGAELFFAKPMSLEVNFSQTYINSQTINKFNGLLNYHVKQYKVMGGYEHLKIGSQDFSMITLGIGVFF
ncbi:outer membrane beta-barrel protein [Seonamhaeicola aphaedonensis]|uniref:Outer membrane protein with beta-barrel domain n=1 Tax=Seonamhaeicola aphaedonensis TaxID=1461338 RepID=A0A3D9HL11_9FLAO|nr:hypothetical protein [Seonamhaeicola aphaedonensis]RED49991.1 hypothetical protein DFQ02_10111 [Seonamhaeicola aphaedonensis]